MSTTTASTVRAAQFPSSDSLIQQEALMSRALVTGCSTGIGRATAIELTKRGFDVVATARRPQTIEDLDVAATLALDVDSDASVASAVAAAGPIDVLVNNAGFGVIGPVELVPLAEVRRMFETNVFGVIRMIQAVLPQMRERESGTIANVTSLAGRVAPPFDGFYSATKFGIEGLSEALHYEVGHFGIRVVLIEPGAFETNFGANELMFGREGGPYDELAKQWDASRDKLPANDTSNGSETVAAAIADAIEAKEHTLRHPVGADAELVTSVRAQLDDATFESTMRETLDLHW
jgi:NAD(P)-dependent dehydrogenase (short-subunit alcohol dehydrogenase family)